MRRKNKTIKVGDVFKFKRFVSERDIQNFAKLSGDFNPIHRDKNFAKKYKFDNVLVHGMLSASFLSTLIGMYLPNKACLYLSQNLTFKKKLYPNQEIEVLGEITGNNESFKILTIQTKILDSKNEVVLDGEAKVKILE